MVELKVRKFGNSLGVVLPKEVINRLQTGDGEKLFGSSHAAIFNCVFADGAVHSIPYTIDRITFERLGDKSDGQLVETGDF